MTTFRTNFFNNSGRTWTMAVFQDIPDSVGLSSVSWKQCTAPDSGQCGVQWDVTWLAAVGNLKMDGGKGVYTASQTKMTELGTEWRIVFKDGVQQLELVGPAPRPEQVLIRNVSGRLADPGFGQSGDPAMFKRDVLSGSFAQFEVTPTYFVGLFNDVVLGEVIDSNVVVGPLTLKFPSGFTTANVTADLDGQTIRLGVTYGNSVAAKVEDVDATIKGLAALRKLRAA